LSIIFKFTVFAADYTHIILYAFLFTLFFALFIFFSFVVGAYCSQLFI